MHSRSKLSETTQTRVDLMSQSGVITFKGNPMTLAGSDLAIGQAAPEFELTYAHEGLKTLTLADIKGKPSVISIVPSLDTPTCAVQTKTFNQKLGEMGDQINAVTVSRDLPFAQARFCGAEEVSMRTASDYKDHAFGESYGVEIEELKLLSRAVIVLDADGKVVYKQVVPEVTEEPNYDAAMQALHDLVS